MQRGKKRREALQSQVLTVLKPPVFLIPGLLAWVFHCIGEKKKTTSLGYCKTNECNQIYYEGYYRKVPFKNGIILPIRDFD